MVEGRDGHGPDMRATELLGYHLLAFFTSIPTYQQRKLPRGPKKVSSP